MFFWPAMAFTSMIGIFIGAVIYNGDVREIGKSIISLASYALLIILTITTRVGPDLGGISPEHYYMPFAGVMTILVVTAFYLLGMCIGVKIIKYAHHKEVKKINGPKID